MFLFMYDNFAHVNRKRKLQRNSGMALIIKRMEYTLEIDRNKKKNQNKDNTTLDHTIFNSLLYNQNS